jgi:hypothetical protein
MSFLTDKLILDLRSHTISKQSDPAAIKHLHFIYA